MEIILLEKIRNLGKLGDTVKVRAGYGRNFLIPQGKAIPATNKNREVFQSRRAELEKAANDALDASEQRANALRALGAITISVRASEEGKLYGSVNTHEIAEALEKMGATVNKSEIMLPNGPIRQTGEYDIEVILHTDVNALVKLQVQPE